MILFVNDQYYHQKLSFYDLLAQQKVKSLDEVVSYVAISFLMLIDELQTFLSLQEIQPK